MKLLASTVLLGAALAAANQQQQVLQKPVDEPVEPAQDGWSKMLSELPESIKNIPAEAKDIWEEVAAFFPEEMSKAKFFSSPKPNTRRPDSHWDYVVKGADVQSVWTETANGEKHREVDGKLDTYNLRAKKVDPKALGVDTVKQYSGYLDDEANDKHLFYCELDIAFCNTMLSQC